MRVIFLTTQEQCHCKIWGCTNELKFSFIQARLSILCYKGSDLFTSIQKQTAKCMTKSDYFFQAQVQGLFLVKHKVDMQ